MGGRGGATYRGDVPTPERPREASRRALLLGGLGIAAVAASQLGGCSPGDESPSPTSNTELPGQHCVPRGTLTSYSRIARSALVYEITGETASFFFDEDFHGAVTDWLTDWSASHARPDQVWSYGAYVDGQPECDSWHAAGRAFDISQLTLAGDAVVSCRYDLWRADTATLDAERRRYWALAASLHARFAYVLTYLYDEAHHNHIHLDDSVSRGARPTFRTTSRTQCQSVQAMCSYLWGRPVELTGRWDAATREATSSVLDDLGRRGTLASAGNWVAFCEASALRV